MPADVLLNVGLVVLVGVLIFFMYRSSKRRRREAEELQSKIQPGVEVMTQHGIFGLLVSVDEESNEAIIETTPGTRLRVHRQTIARVVNAPDETLDDAGDEALGDDAGEPEYGERTDAADVADAVADDAAGSAADDAAGSAADDSPAPKSRKKSAE